MLHNADIDVIQCLHAITFSTGLTQHNNLLNLRSIPSFTFMKHGIGNNGTNKSTSRGYQNHGGGGSSIVKVPGDVPPARVYFFGLLV